MAASDLRLLHSFVVVARCQNISRAALELRVAQPALGRQMVRLEAEMGTPLLHRHRRGVTLTEAGQLLRTEAEALLERHAALRDLVGRRAGVATGTVTIGMPGALGSLLLPSVLHRFAADCPLVRVQVVEGLSGQLTDLLLAGRLDLAIMNNAVASSAVTVAPFLVSRMAFVQAGGMPPAGASIKLAEIARHPLILASPGHTLRQTIDAAFARQRLRVQPRLEVDSLTLLKALVRGGHGATMLNPYVVAEEVARGELSITPIAGRGIFWRLDLALHAERLRRVAVGRLLAIFRDEAITLTGRAGLAGSLGLHPEFTRG
jgi:LysR family nitrogen assimilation transcriptional regulator